MLCNGPEKVEGPEFGGRSGMGSIMIFWKPNPRLSSFITVEQFGVLLLFFFFLIAIVLEVEDGKVSGLGSFSAHVVTPSEA